MVKVRTAIYQCLTVADPGRRHHNHASTAEVCPPAEIDVVTLVLDGRIEATDGAEQISASEKAGGGHREDVAHGIVLLLVELTWLDDRVDLTEAVHAEADVLELTRVVPVDQLRADNARVAAVELLHQDSDGARFESDVVVEEAEEAILALDQVEYLVCRGAETGVPIDGAHEGVWHSFADQGG